MFVTIHVFTVELHPQPLLAAYFVVLFMCIKSHSQVAHTPTLFVRCGLKGVAAELACALGRLRRTALVVTNDAPMQRGRDHKRLGVGVAGQVGGPVFFPQVAKSMVISSQ